MANPSPSPVEDLESRVESLLKDIHDTCDRVEHTLTPPPAQGAPTTDAAGGKGSGGELDRQIEDLLGTAEIAPAAGSAPTPAVQPAGSAAPAGAEEDIGVLDADLARLTDTLLKSNAPLPEVGRGEGPVAAGASSAPAQKAPDAAGPAEEEDLLSAPAVQVRAIKGSETAATLEASDKGPKDPGPTRTVSRSIGPGIVKIGGSVGRAAGPVVLTAMAAASAPLAGRPKVLRDTVGWLALWTVFVSASLWTYLLFFHKPEIPKTEGAPIEFVGQAGKPRPSHVSPERPAEHAEAGNAHAGAHDDPPAKNTH